mgnify:FL=1
MEAHNINNFNIYGAHNPYTTKDFPVKNTFITDKNSTLTEAQNDRSVTRADTVDNHSVWLEMSPAIRPSLLETKVTMSVEKDLNVVITIVKNKNTDDVIRQIPTKETIELLKYLKKYSEQHLLIKENHQHSTILKDL